MPERKPITRSVHRAFSLDHTVEVICRDAFLVDGSKTKTSILAATGGLMTHDWRGQILVLSKLTTTWDPRYYQDVTAADLRVAVDYFVTYGVDDLKSKGRLHPKSGLTVKGVRVNCLGDQALKERNMSPLMSQSTTKFSR